MAQSNMIDSLQQALSNAPDDIAQVNTLNLLAFQYHTISPQRALTLAEEAKTMAEQQDHRKGVADACSNIGVCLAIMGQPEKAIRFFLDALTIREELKDTEGVAKMLNNIAGLYALQEDYEKALDYSTQSLAKLDKTSNVNATGSAHISLGMIYHRKGDLQKSIAEFQQAIKIFNTNKNEQRLSETLLHLGGVLTENGFYARALQTYKEAFLLLENQPLAHQRIDLHVAVAEANKAAGRIDSAHYHLHRAMRMAVTTDNKQAQATCLEKLSQWHEASGRYDSALFYSRKSQLHFKATFNRERTTQMTALEKIYQAEKKEKELEKSANKIHAQQNLLAIAGLLLLVAIGTGIILFQYSRAKKKANRSLQALNLSINEKNEEITLQADRIAELNRSLEEEVMRRTQKIREQNRTLIEYAYFNSHQLRGPLASILGLVSLIRIEWPHVAQDEMLTKLDQSANALDAMVKSMTRKLDSES